MTRLMNMSFKKLNSCFGGSRILCYGAGKRFDEFLNNFEIYCPDVEIACCIDRHPENYNFFKVCRDEKVPVETWETFSEKQISFSCLIITGSAYLTEILKQVDESPVFEQKYVLISALMNVGENYKFDNRKRQRKIPKIIHYCWFGKRQIPDELKVYMESWKKYCPDYKIIRWDENNCDITKNRYAEDAYKAGKWGFVSDFVRLDVLYKYGGIYMDTDVELLKPLDELLYDSMFCGFEISQYISSGLLLGAAERHDAIKKMADVYTELSFYNEDGTMNLTPCPAYQTEVLKGFGIELNGRTQKKRGIAVYAKEFFSPYTVTFQHPNLITDNTFSIHHYSASWQTKEQREGMENNRNNIKRLLDERMEWLPDQ